MDTNYWQLGTWRRIPVSMHWTVLLSFAWLYLFFFDLLATAIGSVAFFFLLVAHEAGHVVVLRSRRIPVQGIELFGIHGRTSHAWSSPGNEILVAWGGVAAQLVVLLAALAFIYAVDLSHPIALTIAAPMLLVFTKLNVFLMIVALLPIGPFDGREAWAAIPWLRRAMRRRRRAAREAAAFPEEHLSPEKRAELEASSNKAAADLIKKLGKKAEDA